MIISREMALRGRELMAIIWLLMVSPPTIHHWCAHDGKKFACQFSQQKLPYLFEGELTDTFDDYQALNAFVTWHLNVN